MSQKVNKQKNPMSSGSLDPYQKGSTISNTRRYYKGGREKKKSIGERRKEGERVCEGPTQAELNINRYGTGHSI